MRHKSFKANACPVARSLDTIGEWRSLLSGRDALGGIRRFADLQKNLGLAKNVLSTRLKKLVACGIMEKVPAWDGSAHREYALTQKGRELFPVILLLCASREKVISSPSTRNVFRFWTNARANPCAGWKCKTRKGKSLRRTIWSSLLLRIEWTFTASNFLLTPERKGSQCTTRSTIALSTMHLQCRPNVSAATTP